MHLFEVKILHLFLAYMYLSLLEKSPNTDLFLVRIFLYSVRIQEIRAKNNSVFGHFSCSLSLVTSRFTELLVDGFMIWMI